MALTHMKSAEATAKIQFAVSLLKDGMNGILKEAAVLKDPLDFNKSLKMVGENIAIIFPDPDVQQQLPECLERARFIRNQYSHQKFDSARFEHDVECLLKLASLMGLGECRKEIMKFAGISSEDWEKLKTEGNKHYKNGRWTEAMNCYTKAIRIKTKVAVLYSNRALCELKLSKFDLACEDAKDAVALDPTQVKFYRSLSEALCNLLRYKDAHEVCENGLKIDPTDKVLIERLQHCKAFGVDEETNEHPMASIEEMRNTDVYIKLLERQRKSTSDVPPDDVFPIDSMKWQIMLEVYKANHILRSHRGNTTEEHKAFEVFKSAANRGSAEGLYNMATMYRDRRAGLARDPMKYLELCRKAAEQKPYLSARGNILPNVGVAEAENSIGIAYRDGLAVNQDKKLAFQWFLKSAQHGCPSAMNSLGLALANATGCERNLTSARSWFQKASDLGQSEAQFNLAGMLIRGEGGPVDKSKAAELLQSAADQGRPGALEARQQLMRCNSAKNIA